MQKEQLLELEENNSTIPKRIRKRDIFMGVMLSIVISVSCNLKTSNNANCTNRHRHKEPLMRVIDISGGEIIPTSNSKSSMSQSKSERKQPRKITKRDLSNNKKINPPLKEKSTTSIFVSGLLPDHNFQRNNANHGRLGYKPTEGNPFSHRGPKSITARFLDSENSVCTQTQISGFLKKDGTVDLKKCVSELNRKASKLNQKNFECSTRRFENLATENGQLTAGSAREAMSALQGEIMDFYENTHRIDYGPGISGPDFGVKGKGEYKHITHLEVKGAVGSAILESSGQGSSLSRHGRNIGKKIRWQTNQWSDSDTVQSMGFDNVNLTALPKSQNNILALVDLVDVRPLNEKSFLEAKILKTLKKNDTNINLVFINNN